MGSIDVSKIPTKTVTIDGANLDILKGRTVGLVLVEDFCQVTFVITTKDRKEAQKLFSNFKGE